MSPYCDVCTGYGTDPLGLRQRTLTYCGAAGEQRSRCQYAGEDTCMKHSLPFYGTSFRMLMDRHLYTMVSVGIPFLASNLFPSLPPSLPLSL